mmetsp:Transcript_29165/g.53754  ORF Transcript_29165/g.53754 Transcript_29165/m.53754 type:complete len:155 (-) Transcript_29165:18-482(-)
MYGERPLHGQCEPFRWSNAHGPAASGCAGSVSGSPIDVETSTRSHRARLRACSARAGLTHAAATIGTGAHSTCTAVPLAGSGVPTPTGARSSKRQCGQQKYELDFQSRIRSSRFEVLQSAGNGNDIISSSPQTVTANLTVDDDDDDDDDDDHDE